MSGVEPGALMLAEMSEQPECVDAVLAAVLPVADHLARVVHEADSVVFLGRGSSRSAATFGIQAIRAFTDRPAYQLSPAELAWGHSHPDLAGSLVVALSQSGESPEVIAAAEQARAMGSHLVVITNSVSSPLALTASDERSVLSCRAGTERAVPATKSFTSSLACALSLALADDTDRLVRARRELPGLMRDVLSDPRFQFDIAGVDGFVMAGDGFAECVAEEGAIKVRETMRTIVASIESSELLHGSVNSVRAGNCVVAIGADQLSSQLAVQVIAEASRRGAMTVYIGPDTNAGSDWTVALPPAEPHWIPFLAILPIQHAARTAALAAGLNPDAPSGLNKITRIDSLHRPRVTSVPHKLGENKQ